MICKLSNRVGAAPVGDVDDLACIDVDEQRNVVVAAFRRRFVDCRAPERGEIHPSQCRLDVVLDDAPQARVVLADQPRGGGHRHVRDQRHGERFEQQCEP